MEAFTNCDTCAADLVPLVGCTGTVFCCTGTVFCCTRVVFGAKIRNCDTCAVDLVALSLAKIPKAAFATPVQRIWCQSQHLRRLCSGFRGVGGLGIPHSPKSDGTNGVLGPSPVVHRSLLADLLTAKQEPWLTSKSSDSRYGRRTRTRGQ